MRREPTADRLPVYGLVAPRTARKPGQRRAHPLRRTVPQALRRTVPQGRLSRAAFRSCCGCGCWRRAGSGAAEPCWVCCDRWRCPGRGAGAYRERSQRISLRMLPVDGGAGAGPPGTARRMTQQSPQHQGYLVAAVRPQRPRGRRCAVPGGPIGGAAQPGSAAILVTGQTPGDGSAPARRSAFLGACLSRGSLVVSKLRRPLNNQAAAPCAWGWSLLHPYTAENRRRS